jgi:lysophospholipase L1-like esterase
MIIPRILTILAPAMAMAALATARAAIDDYALRDGDTVAFLGDSITAARDYSKLVETYTVLRFPERKIRFLNAGMGGETAKGSLNRLDEAVFAKGATVVTVAYGVNDIGWGTKADAAHQAEYLESLGTLIDRCRARGVRVFICSAAITAEAPDSAERGFLQTMCDQGLALAKARGAGAIDVQREMREVQRRVLAANAKQPDASKHISLHAPDGVHLNDLGQVAMGCAILRGLGAPADVSWATLDAKSGAVTQRDGCTVSEVQSDGDSLRFTRLDARLPLNMAPLWMLHGFYIPISEDFNRYGLTVTGLDPGRYEIKAGGRPLGVWSAEELSKGVNIAAATADPWQPGGPWQAQGFAVKSFTDLRDTLDFTRRDVSAHLGAHPRHKELTAQAAAIEEQLLALRRELARPVPVSFELRRLPAVVH